MENVENQRSATSSPLRGWIREMVPAWVRDVHGLGWQVRTLGMGRASRWRARISGLLNRMTGRPKYLRLDVTSCRLSAFDVRPFTTDLQVLLSIHVQGEYQEVRQSLPRANFIVDLGSNVGATLRLWADWFPNAVIVGVEPDAENCALAKRNVHALGGRVSVVHAAIAAQAGRVSLIRDGEEAWGYRTSGSLRPDASRDSVAAVTLDDVAGPQIAAAIDLLKCDIEGAEEELFADCRAWIDRVRYIAVETHHPYTLERMRADLVANDASFEVVHVRQHGLNEIALLRNVAQTPATAKGN